MAVNFNLTWTGGATGIEEMPAGYTTLYYTLVMAELPAGGVYGGPGLYQLTYAPREDGLLVYVNGDVSTASPSMDEIILVNSPAISGHLSVTYRPLSDLLYFGDNEDAVTNGRTFTAPLMNTHLTAIMHRLAQVEYAVNLPVSLWNGIEVTVDGFNDYNFIDDPAIVYLLQQRTNQLAEYISDAYELTIPSIETVIDPNVRRFRATDIMEIRQKISQMQLGIASIL
jgi:hypothetical protein